MSEVSGRKLLIAANNINYVISHSLVSICRRLSERGVKFTDTILKSSRQKLSLLRQSLIEKYINIKRARINSIVESADYSFVLQTYGKNFNPTTCILSIPIFTLRCVCS